MSHEEELEPVTIKRGHTHQLWPSTILEGVFEDEDFPMKVMQAIDMNDLKRQGGNNFHEQIPDGPKILRQYKQVCLGLAKKWLDDGGYPEQAWGLRKSSVLQYNHGDWVRPHWHRLHSMVVLMYPEANVPQDTYTGDVSTTYGEGLPGDLVVMLNQGHTMYYPIPYFPITPCKGKFVVMPGAMMHYVNPVKEVRSTLVADMWAEFK